MGQGASVLLAAARDGDIATVRRLLANDGVDVNMKDEDGWSPLWRASDKGHLDVVKTLIEAGANIHNTDKDNTTPLYVASQNGHLGVVQILLGAGADVNIARSNDGWSPLMTASYEGHLDVVKTLIEAGANVNHTNKDNATPLYVASENGHLGVVQTLLGAGADVNIARSANGWSPLMIASGKGDLDVLKTLIEAGANVNHTNKDNATPLYVSSEKGHLGVVQTLLGAGADVNIARSADGWSPLMTASGKGDLDVVKTLIEAGANVNHTNKTGKTFLDIAVEKGHKELIEALKTPQSKMSQQNTRQLHDLKQQKEQELRDPRQQKEQTEQELRDPKQQKEQIEQELRDMRQQKEQTEQALRDMRQQKEQTEQELHGMRQQKEHELHDIRQQMEQDLHNMRQQKEQTEQELRDMRQQKEQTEQQLCDMRQQMEQELHDMTQQVEAYKQQAQTAYGRATRAEQELRLSRQQAEEQLRGHLAQLTVEDIPQNLKSSWRVQSDEIQVIEGRPLGVGGWGEVRVAMFRGVKVAAKFIHEAIISPHNIDLFIREMNIAACVRHPNLLLFIGASLEGNKPVIITELMQDNLRSRLRTLTPLHDHVISIGTDVACALNYLHLMKPEPIIHRDVSSANVLLEPIGSGSWRGKVSDYGSANFVSMVTTKGPGNASYAAPESSNPEVQSPKMDVYSYGILLLEMATGQFPDHKVQATRLKTLQWQEMAVLIRRCICEDPASRIDMKDVLLLLPQLNK